MSKHVLYDYNNYLIHGDEPEWVERYVNFCEANDRAIRLDAPFNAELFEDAMNKVWEGWRKCGHEGFNEAATDLINRIRREYELKWNVDPAAVFDYALNRSDLDWEKVEDNLIHSDPIDGTAILCVARLGLWTGRAPAWKIINSLNLADCLRVDKRDYVTMYTEGGQFVIRNKHQDGTSYYSFYEIKGDPNELVERLYNKVAAIELIRDGSIEPLGSAVNKIYGWED